MSTEQNDYFIAANDLTDFVTGKIIRTRIDEGFQTYNATGKFICTRPQWAEFWVKGQAFANGQLTEISDTSGMIIFQSADEGIEQFVSYSVSNSGVDVRAVGSEEFCNAQIDFWSQHFDESTSNIEWIYGGDGSSVTVALRKDRVPVSEMYSFLKDETLEQYYDRFMASTASILLLIGPPGTGKTSFIRGLLQHTETNAIVTYDPAVLAKDYVFAQFIEGDSSVFIIEDADTLLRARSDGNDMMHKFLNVGDGLVTTAGKKMIFSTNLPSVKDVDQALLRPGRCFDVLHFGNLDQQQAEALCVKLGLPAPSGKKEYSLAELFHTQTATAPKSVKRGMGFV
jgi:hypothetical protein